MYRSFKEVERCVEINSAWNKRIKAIVNSSKVVDLAGYRTLQAMKQEALITPFERFFEMKPLTLHEFYRNILQRDWDEVN